MKIRSDSPFAGIDQEMIDLFLDVEGEMTLEEMVAELAKHKPPIICSEQSLKRFLRRVKTEQLLEDAKENGEAFEGVAELEKNGRMRDVAIEATRQKLYARALESEDKETLLEVFRTFNEEKARDRELGVEERKAAATELNARVRAQALEWERAESAARLLPQLRELLSDSAIPTDERVARALECLMKGGGRLLGAGESGSPAGAGG